MSLAPVFSLLFGAALGSFLNVVILRNKHVSQAPSPAGKTPGVNGKTPGVEEAGVSGVEEAPVRKAGVILGRSQCPFCRRQLTWPELIPILSFVFLQGRCRRCRHSLSLQYSLVELSLAIFTIILFTPLPSAFYLFSAAALNLIIISLLVVLFVIDLRTLILPDIFIVLLAVVVALTLITNYQLLVTSYWLLHALLGMAIGSGVLAFLWLITRGRGIGLGDIKLMLPLGALFGPIDTAVLLFLAFMAGGAVGAFLLLTGRAHMKTPIPFGPFLAGAAILFVLIPALPQAILNIIF